MPTQLLLVDSELFTHLHGMGGVVAGRSCRLRPQHRLAAGDAHVRGMDDMVAGLVACVLGTDFRQAKPLRPCASFVPGAKTKHHPTSIIRFFETPHSVCGGRGAWNSANCRVTRYRISAEAAAPA